MWHKLRALLGALGLVAIVAALVVYVNGERHVRQETAQEASNWSVSASAAREIQPPTTTTAPPPTASPTTTVASTQPATVPETTASTLPTTTVATTVPQPVPPDSIETHAVFGRIVIPRLGIPNEAMPVLPLLEGDIADRQKHALDSGTSHWPGSSLPGGGGNVVIGGHRTSYMRPFYLLDTMQIGDEIEIVTDWGAYTYQVYHVELMVPAGTSAEQEQLKQLYTIPQLDRPGETLTVYTCTPTDSSSHRIVVQADLIQVNGVDV
jgi:LPXTG-site transpeptidase (sortase) family protein